jgi:protein translocase SecG subunit
MDIQQIFTIAQIIVSIALIICILLQQRGAGSSALTGGGSASYYTKRGFEKVLFMATIILALLFLATSLIRFFIG